MNRNTVDNPFEDYGQAISIAASEMYRAEVEGVEPDPDKSRVNILPRAIGATSLAGVEESDILRRAQVQEAEVNHAAGMVVRLATLHDTVDKGGILGLIGRFEIAATKLIDRKATRQALESGAVDRVRNRA